MDLAFAKGMLAGRNYGLMLLRPGYMGGGRARCPYWHPLKWLVWRLAFSAGAFQVIYGR